MNRKLIAKSSISPSELLKKLNDNGKGIVFIVNEEEILQGVITDGDIRRYLMIYSKLPKNIYEILNRDYIYSYEEEHISYMRSKLSDKIKFLPIINREKHLKNILQQDSIKSIPIASPKFTGNEYEYLMDCIQTGWISSQGEYILRFEELFSQYHGYRNAVSCSNGTTALHLAIVSLGIKKGDEIIVPNLTFAASINAIVHSGATPIIVDTIGNGNISIDRIKEYITPRTRAIMCVHLYGMPCEMEKIIHLCNDKNLLLIEDCAEAIGSKYKGALVGTFGNAACFSFFGNKTITSGEGGMILFKNPLNSEIAKQLRDHGMSKTKRYWHDKIGFNYRLTNMQAAVGLAQLEQINSFIKEKKRIALEYTELFSKYRFIDIPVDDETFNNTFWLYTIFFKEEYQCKRDKLIDYLNKRKVDARKVFYPLSEMPIYKPYVKGNYPVSNSLSKRGVSFNCSPSLENEDLKYLLMVVKNFMEEINE